MRSSSWSGGSAAWGALTALAVLVLTGCWSSSPGPPEVSPESERDVPQVYREEIDTMFAAGYLTEYEQGVLEDYWVTDAEYAQAREIVRACLEEREYVMVLEGTEVSVYPRPGGPAEGGQPQHDALAECESGVTPHIEGMYIQMRDNPEALTWHEAVLLCIDRYEDDERFDLAVGRGLTQEEMWERMEEDEAFLWPCTTLPIELAVHGEWPVDDIYPPPGEEPFTPRPVEP